MHPTAHRLKKTNVRIRMAELTYIYNKFCRDVHASEIILKQITYVKWHGIAD